MSFKQLSKSSILLISLICRLLTHYSDSAYIVLNITLCSRMQYISVIALHQCSNVAVVIFCHSSISVLQSYLFAAQDKGMTSGDYAFFTFSDIVSSATFQPWTAFNVTDDDIQYRMQAFYAVKQVELQQQYLIVSSLEWHGMIQIVRMPNRVAVF